MNRRPHPLHSRLRTVLLVAGIGLSGCAPPAPLCEVATNSGCPDGWRCEEGADGPRCAPRPTDASCALTCGDGFVCMVTEEAPRCAPSPDAVTSIALEQPLNGAILDNATLQLRCRVELAQRREVRLLHTAPGGTPELLSGVVAAGTNQYTASWQPADAPEGLHTFACEAVHGPDGWTRTVTTPPTEVYVDRGSPVLSTADSTPWLMRGAAVPLAVTAVDAGAGIRTVTTAGKPCVASDTAPNRYECPVNVAAATAGAITAPYNVPLAATDMLGRRTDLTAEVRVDDIRPQLSLLSVDCPGQAGSDVTLQLRITDAGSGLAPDAPLASLADWFTLSWTDTDNALQRRDANSRQGDTYLYTVPADARPPSGRSVVATARDAAGNSTSLSVELPCP